MTYKQVIKHFGSAIHAAKFLDISIHAVYSWQKRGHISEHMQLKIQFLTDGELKAELD